MRRRAHLAGWLLLWLTGLVAWPLWAGPERLQQRTLEERAAVERTFGPRVGRLLIHAAGVGAAALTQAGGVDGGEYGLAPTRTGVRAGQASAGLGRGLSDLPRLVVDRSDRYLTALELQFHGAVLRAAAMAAWTLLLLPLLFAGIVDSLAQRSATLDSLGYQSPAAFALASHALIICAMVPLIVLMLPFSVPHAFMPVWMMSTLLPLATAIRHMQPVFTR